MHYHNHLVVPSHNHVMERRPGTPEESRVLVRTLACVLQKLVDVNRKLDSPGAQIITKFHASRPPSISINEYLERINKYASCSTECLVLALIYVDRLIQQSNFALSSLNIHRVIITSVMLAAKFFDDQYFNNMYYAKVGGVPCTEINSLEVEYLFLVNFSLHVTEEVYYRYFNELMNHAANSSCPCCAGGRVPRSVSSNAGTVSYPSTPRLPEPPTSPSMMPPGSLAPPNAHANVGPPTDHTHAHPHPHTHTTGPEMFTSYFSGKMAFDDPSANALTAATHGRPSAIVGGSMMDGPATQQRVVYPPPSAQAQQVAVVAPKPMTLQVPAPPPPAPMPRAPSVVSMVSEPAAFWDRAPGSLRYQMDRASEMIGRAASKMSAVAGSTSSTAPYESRMSSNVAPMGFASHHHHHHVPTYRGVTGSSVYGPCYGPVQVLMHT